MNTLLLLCALLCAAPARCQQDDEEKKPEEPKKEEQAKPRSPGEQFVDQLLKTPGAISDMDRQVLESLAREGFLANAQPVAGPPPGVRFPVSIGGELREILFTPGAELGFMLPPGAKLEDLPFAKALPRGAAPKVREAQGSKPGAALEQSQKSGALGQLLEFAGLRNAVAPVPAAAAPKPAAPPSPSPLQAKPPGAQPANILKSGYRLEGRTLVDAKGNKAGYLTSDKERYGGQEVLFAHFGNKTGYDGPAWKVYTKDGVLLGDYEAVRARAVLDHDGKPSRAVLAYAGRENESYGNALFKSADGRLYTQAMDSYGQRVGPITPYFTRAEESKLANAALVAQMPEGKLKEFLLDREFEKRFPIAQHRALAAALPELLDLIAKPGADSAAALKKHETLLREARARYQAEYEKAQARYEAAAAAAKKAPASEKERLEYEALRLADLRNREKWRVHDLDGMLRAFAPGEQLGERLAALSRGPAGPARPGEDSLREAARGLTRLPQTYREQARLGEQRDDVRARAAALPPGSGSRKLLDAEAKRLDREIDRLITERKNLPGSIERELRAARAKSGDEATAHFLEGALSAWEWDYALRDRRNSFDVSVSILSDPGASPAQKKWLLKRGQ